MSQERVEFFHLCVNRFGVSIHHCYKLWFRPSPPFWNGASSLTKMMLVSRWSLTSITFLFIIVTTGGFGHGNPWLQPAGTGGRQPCFYSSTDEAFLSQLWFPTSTTVFHPLATTFIFFQHAVLHSGPWKMPWLLQYPHDTSEWRGGTTETSTFLWTLATTAPSSLLDKGMENRMWPVSSEATSGA